MCDLNVVFAYNIVRSIMVTLCSHYAENAVSGSTLVFRSQERRSNDIARPLFLCTTRLWPSLRKISGRILLVVPGRILLVLLVVPGCILLVVLSLVLLVIPGRVLLVVLGLILLVVPGRVLLVGLGRILLVVLGRILLRLRIPCRILFVIPGRILLVIPSRILLVIRV